MISSVIYLFYFTGILLFTLCLRLYFVINYVEQMQDLFGSAIPSKSEYDVIIVGGGLAGSAIAAGIDHDSVLLIEAGNDAAASTQFSAMLSDVLNGIPIAAPVFQRQSLYDWRYETIEQEKSCGALESRISLWPMGKGLGGSQLLNNMIYHRGHPDDFVGWFTRSDQYNYKQQIMPFFKQFEDKIKLQDLAYRSNFSLSFMNGVEEFGYRVPDDFYHPKVMQNMGKRWTVAKSLATETIEILPNAQVEQVLLARDDSHGLKATGIVYTQNGLSHDVHATKAVILAAGTVGTPTILLKSGVGPEEFYVNQTELRMQQHLPAVGKHLQDHITTGLDLIFLNESLGLEPWQVYSFSNLKSYFVDGTGPLTTTGCEALGFVRSTLANRTDDRPDLGFMLVPLGIAIDAGVHMREIFNIDNAVWLQYFEPLIGRTTVSIMPVLLHPRSRGSLTIALDDSDRWRPRIDPRYLTHPDDVRVLVEGLRIVEQLLEMPSMRKYNAEINPKPFPGCEQHTWRSNEYWQCYVRQLTLTAYHPIGTCRMGTNAHESVVNADNFKVHNIGGLFICDASIMPQMPSGNPQATIGMLTMKFLASFNAKVN